MKNTQMLSWLLGTGLLWVSGAVWSVAQDWNQWRGPGRDGIVREVQLPETLPGELKQVWSVDVGPGLASPLFVEDRIYSITRRGKEEEVTARSRENGRVIWSARYEAPFIPNAQATSPRLFPVSLGRGPFATPVLSQGILVTLGVDRTASAFQAEDGKLLWRHRLLPAVTPERIIFECPPCGMECDGKEYHEAGDCPNSSCPLQLSPKGLETSATFDGTRGNYYGAAASPLVHEDMVILNVGNAEAGQLSAYQLESGKELWRWSGSGVSSSSPVLAEVDGIPQVIVLSRTSLNGVDVRDGAELWSHSLTSNAQIVTPIVTGNLVIFSAYRSPTTALRLLHQGSDWRVEPAWQNDEVTLYTSTPVLEAGILYGLSYSGRGRFFALDMATGELKWATQGREGQSASIQSTGQHLLVLLDSGELRVLGIDPSQYRLEASYTVSESPTWAHPVFYRNQVLVKNENQLILYQWSSE